MHTTNGSRGVAHLRWRGLSPGSTPAARRLPRPHTYSVSGYEPDWDVAVAARQLSDPSHLSASASGKGFDVGYGSGESTPRRGLGTGWR